MATEPIDFAKGRALVFGSLDDRLKKHLPNIVAGLNSALEQTAGVNIPFVLIMGTDDTTIIQGNRDPAMLKSIVKELAQRWE